MTFTLTAVFKNNGLEIGFCGLFYLRDKADWITNFLNNTTCKMLILIQCLQQIIFTLVALRSSKHYLFAYTDLLEIFDKNFIKEYL
jgi:hypothetical protein